MNIEGEVAYLIFGSCFGLVVLVVALYVWFWDK